MTTGWTPIVLLVSDPVMCSRSDQVLRPCFPARTFVTWDINSGSSDAEARAAVSSRPWDIVFSVHNDLVFSARELALMRLPLNLHPALPILPGRGHDIVPILEHHTEVGVTLHEMTTEIDSGRIFHVDRTPLHRDTTRAQLRQLTQSLCLRTLEWAAHVIKQAGSTAEARRLLTTRGNGANFAWGTPRRTRKDVARLVENVRKTTPESPILR
jgi:folate-dependent phosphoribosylglycinamide formyltransferase PurN